MDCTYTRYFASRTAVLKDVADDDAGDNVFHCHKCNSKLSVVCMSKDKTGFLAAP